MSSEISAAIAATTATAEAKGGAPARLTASTASPSGGEAGASGASTQEAPTSVSARTVSELANHVHRVFRDIELNVDPGNGEVVVRVRDRETGEVVRQIPAEEMLRLARFMRELQEEHLSGLPGAEGGGHEGFLLHTRA
jgi:flagellar protein FlaG